MMQRSNKVHPCFVFTHGDGVVSYGMTVPHIAAFRERDGHDITVSETKVVYG